MKIDCQEIRRVVRRTQREGVSTVETPLAAELMRQKEFTDAEVDWLCNNLGQEPPDYPPDIGVREPARPNRPTMPSQATTAEEES